MCARAPKTGTRCPKQSPHLLPRKNMHRKVPPKKLKSCRVLRVEAAGCGECGGPHSLRDGSFDCQGSELLTVTSQPPQLLSGADSGVTLLGFRQMAGVRWFASGTSARRGHNGTIVPKTFEDITLGRADGLQLFVCKGSSAHLQSSLPDALHVSSASHLVPFSCYNG